MIEPVVERAFIPAAEAVETGEIPGATLGLVTASGERAVRIAGYAAIDPGHEDLTRARSSSGHQNLSDNIERVAYDPRCPRLSCALLNILVRCPLATNNLCASSIDFL